MIDNDRWNSAQKAEKESWDIVLASDGDIIQYNPSKRHFPVMGLSPESNFFNQYVVDIGGGALSLLLNFHKIHGLVVDPIQFNAEWIQRYSNNGIDFLCSTAEDFLETFDSGILWDEVWIYNTLQHVKDPEFILRNVRKVSSVLRISEPCLTPIDTPHPHSFTPEWMFKILDEISVFGEHARVDYDYPYVGGVFHLK